LEEDVTDSSKRKNGEQQNRKATTRAGLILVLCACLSVSMLHGCRSMSEDGGVFKDTHYYDQSSTPNAAPDYYAETESLRSSDYGETSIDLSDSISRKIVYSYNYNLETTDMSSTLSMLEDGISSSGGYIQSSTYSGRDVNNQYSSVSIICRIPVTSVDSFKALIEDAGVVQFRSESGEDITDVYFDVETRLSTLRIQEARLLQLLEQSGDLSDILEIERELMRVRTDIEQLTTTLQKYDNLVDLTTFTVSIYNVSEYSPTPDDSFFTKLQIAFNDSWQSALMVFQNLILILIYLMPYLLVVCLILTAILLISRKRRAKRLTQQSQALVDQNAYIPMYDTPTAPMSAPEPPSAEPPLAGTSVAPSGEPPAAQPVAPPVAPPSVSDNSDDIFMD